MRKPFKEKKLFKGGNYMRKYGTYCTWHVVGSALVRSKKSNLVKVIEALVHFLYKVYCVKIG